LFAFPFYGAVSVPGRDPGSATLPRAGVR